MNILVVGASRGIGKSIAINLAKDGHNILITGRNEDTLVRSAEDIRVAANDCDVHLKVADITSADDTASLSEYVQNEFKADGIVLCAAQFPKPETKTSVTNASVSELSSILDSNVVANYRFIKENVEYLKSRKYPRIVIIGSTAGVRQDKGGVYGISKWALSSYAYNLRDELKPYGIGVSLINPGGTFTETRVKKTPDDMSLLESNDFGILVAALFRMSPQAVMERVDVRPIVGDTY